MPAVKVKDNEPFDVALRRLKRSCEKAGVLSKCAAAVYEKPQERKRKPSRRHQAPAEEAFPGRRRRTQLF